MQGFHPKACGRSAKCPCYCNLAYLSTGKRTTMSCFNESSQNHEYRWYTHYFAVHYTESTSFLMMTAPNGNIFRVTGPLCGEFTGLRWIPRSKASDAELWCFFLSASEYTVELTMVRLVNWDAIAPIMTSPLCLNIPTHIIYITVFESIFAVIN